MTEDSDQLTLFPNEQSKWWERAIVVVPAIVALSVGGLYAGGALVKAAQLRGEGLSIRETLPLLPLETILGAGISVVIQSLVLLLALMVLAVLSLFFGRKFVSAMEARADELEKKRLMRLKRVGDDLQSGDPNRIEQASKQLDRERQHTNRQLRLATAVLLVLAALTASLMLLAPPVITATFVLSAAAMVSTRVAGYSLRRYLPHMLAIQYIILLAGLVTMAFVYPSPLPKTEVHLGQGRSIPGRLIIATGGTWYMARGEKIVAIPIANFQRGSIRAETRDPPSSTGTILLDWLSGD